MEILSIPKHNIKEILTDSINRPTSKQALEISEENIIKKAKQIGYKLYPETMEKIYKVHEAFMPVIENGLVSLLSENEINNPDYYCFARDGELLYDAFWGVGEAGEDKLQERIHYLKTSMGMDDDKNISRYLKETGITKSRFEEGPKMVFLDSGFRGSLFHKVGNWSSYGDNLPNNNLKGYLICMVENSSFAEVNLNFPNKIDKSVINSILKDSPYFHHSQKDNFNRTTCAFMQLMPKFTGRYVKIYQKGSGIWDVLPEQNSLISKFKINPNKNNLQTINCSQENSIEYQPDEWSINSDIVHPVASLLLQKKTLDYFTDPNVHDRIYSKVKN